jgi:hypothetical protein
MQFDRLSYSLFYSSIYFYMHCQWLFLLRRWTFTCNWRTISFYIVLYCITLLRIVLTRPMVLVALRSVCILLNSYRSVPTQLFCCGSKKLKPSRVVCGIPRSYIFCIRWTYCTWPRVAVCIHIYALMTIRYTVSAYRTIQLSGSAVCRDISVMLRHECDSTGGSSTPPRHSHFGVHQRVVDCMHPIAVVSNIITPVCSVRNFGSHVDSTVPMRTQIVSNCFAIIRSISRSVSNSVLIWYIISMTNEQLCIIYAMLKHVIKIRNDSLINILESHCSPTVKMIRLFANMLHKV